MTKKLDKKDCKENIKHHEKRVSYYEYKLKDINKESQTIGFKY